MKVHFVIPGKPKGKARPRIVYTGNQDAESYTSSSAVPSRISAEDFRLMQNGKKARPKGRAYTPQDTLDYENLVKNIYGYQVVHKFPDDKPLFIRVKAYFPIPKATSKKKRIQMLNGEIRPTVKPDGDNILKIICDALNTIAFSDDKVLIDKHVEKWYGETPRVEVDLADEPLMTAIHRYICPADTIRKLRQRRTAKEAC